MRAEKERDAYRERAEEALNLPPRLPGPEYQYGHDARELYDFGWKQAQIAIRAHLADAGDGAKEERK